MTSILRATVLLSVLFASFFAGIDGALVMQTAGQDVDCEMECCQPTEAETSCCASEKPEVVIVSPCGCDGSAPSAVLELNRIDWAPSGVAPDADLAWAGSPCIDLPQVPDSRVPSPETAPPRA